MRTSGPDLPSGRRLASTGQIVPSRGVARSRPASASRRAGWRPRRACCSSDSPVHRLGHEDHVHVADVVELVAAALAHRDHGEPAAAARPRRPWRGPRRAPRPACRRRGRRARRRRRRRRGGGRGRGRRAGAAPGGTPPAARPRASAYSRVATGSAVAGSAPTARSSPSRMAYAAGRVDPSVGSVQLVPVLGVPAQVVAQRLAGPEHARAAASRCPRRRPPPCSSASRSSTASASATRAASAWSGSALRAISGNERLGDLAELRPAAAARGRGRGSRAAPGCPR